MEGEITEKNIKNFVTSQSLPLVIDFNHETAQKIFGGEVKSHLLMFLSQQEGHIDKYLDDAREVAKGFRGQVFIYVFSWLFVCYAIVTGFVVIKCKDCHTSFNMPF